MIHDQVLLDAFKDEKDNVTTGQEQAFWLIMLVLFEFHPVQDE